MVVSPIFLALLSAALFGAAAPLSKPLLGELSPLQLAGLLYLGAAIGVLPAVLRGPHGHGTEPWHRRSVLRLTGAIVCGGILGPLFLLYGLRLASAASVALWLNMEVVATAVLGQLVFRDHLGRAGWFGVLGALAAGVLLSTVEGYAGAAALSLVTLACLCWGLDNHFTALIDGMSPARVTFWKGSVAGVVNLVIGVSAQPFTASPRLTALALLVGMCCYGASIVLYITAAQRVGATRAQLVFAASPLFGVALAAGFLAESVSAGQMAAAGIFLVSIVLVLRSRHSHGHEHHAFSHTHAHRHDDGHHDHHQAGQPVPAAHAHPHRHQPVAHAHPHWPDLHHRHDHR